MGRVEEKRCKVAVPRLGSRGSASLGERISNILGSSSVLGTATTYTATLTRHNLHLHLSRGATRLHISSALCLSISFTKSAS